MQVCPPCPKGALCKPCPPDAIFLTDSLQEKFKYALKLNVHFGKTKQFKVGDYGVYSFLSLSSKVKIDQNLTSYHYRLLGYDTYKKQP